MDPICENCSHAQSVHGYSGVCSSDHCSCERFKRAQDEKTSSPERVHHPQHYNMGNIEVKDFIVDQKLNFFLGNVIKYVCRAGRKSDTKTLEDLRKARQYLDFEIEEVEKELDK